VVPKVKSVRLSLISIAKLSFSEDCHLRRLRSTSKTVSELELMSAARIAAASRTGQFEHFRVIHHHSTFVPFIIFLASLLSFGIADGGTFLSLFNISLVVQQVTIIATVGIAPTLIILTAGIDLSVGAILVLSQMVMARLAVQNGLPVEVALATGSSVMPHAA
jgi:ABC-type xylose transport system permease subunit